MKKVFFIILLCLSLFVFASCSDNNKDVVNDDTTPVTNAPQADDAADDTQPAQESGNNNKDDVSKPEEFIAVDTDNGFYITEYTGNAKKLIVPDEIDGKTVVGIKAGFYPENDFEEIVLPAGLLKIEKGMFMFNADLKKVTFNNGLKEIGINAFYGCSGLTEIEIPASVEVIHGNAFGLCENLNKVTLNEGLKKVGYSSFASTAVETFVFPASVEVIEHYVVSFCENIREVRFLGKNADIDDRVIDDSEGFTVYGYAGSTAEQMAVYNNYAFVAIE